MATKTFTDFALRRGDNDLQKRWGGAISTATGTPVQDLQSAIKAVGIDVGADGDFGAGTVKGVRQFQWNVTNVKVRMVNNALQTRALSPAIQVNGIADAATAAELNAWVSVHARVTGNLVRADASAFSQFVASFQTIANPSIASGELVIDASFARNLAALNQAARDANVKLFINQAFRVQGVPVSGAVVPPATKSQHLIGHAIDCNIQDGSTRVNSANFANGSATAGAKRFVQNAKNAGLRWGGDFGTPDFVHFDDNIAASSEGYDMRFLFNQRMIAKQQPLPTA